MNAACKSCKHSARCVPNAEEYPPQLFHDIASREPFDLTGITDKTLSDVIQEFAHKLRNKFLSALPEGCPFVTPERRKLTEVHWEFVGDELHMKLIYPRYMLGGGYSIGTRWV